MVTVSWRFSSFLQYSFADSLRVCSDWIRGRVDDVINVSGHRLSTAEIESALIMHNGVAETAVVGVSFRLLFFRRLCSVTNTLSAASRLPMNSLDKPSSLTLP